jgi:hypothetical protein
VEFLLPAGYYQPFTSIDLATLQTILRESAEAEAQLVAKTKSPKLLTLAHANSRRQAVMQAAVDNFAALLTVVQERDQLKAAIVELSDEVDYCQETSQEFDIARLHPDTFDLVIRCLKERNAAKEPG